MTIAVNTRFLTSNMEGVGNYSAEILKRLVIAHPEHHFIFLFDRPFNQGFIYASNVTPVIVRPAARHPLLWKWWFDISVAAALRKYKADVFLSMDGFASLTTRVPQVLVVHDLAFLHYPKFQPAGHARFQKRYMPRFLRKASAVVAVSNFTKFDIEQQYPFVKNIRVVPNAARSIFFVRDEEEKQNTKGQLTEGREYFIYGGSIHPRKNLVNLLKAFSIFKKRQQSNWKLVLAGRTAWHAEKFIASLSTYKYRSDVVLTGYVPDDKLASLVGAAYAMVYPSLWEGFGVPVLEALQSGVPVITTAGSAMQEVAAAAGIYTDVTDVDQLADAMMRMYKDEQLRSDLVEKGLLQASNYNWDQSAAMMWEILEQFETK